MRPRRPAAALAILLLLATGCAGRTGASDEASSGDEVPACASVWVPGRTVPPDYEGCLAAGGTLRSAVVVDCVSGPALTTYDDAFVARLGGRVTAARAGSAAYDRARERCTGGRAGGAG